MRSRPIYFIAQRLLLAALTLCVAQQQLRSGTCCCQRVSSVALTALATAIPPPACPFCARSATGAGKSAAVDSTQAPVSGRTCHCCRPTMADATKAVIEDVPFMCHAHHDENGQPNRICHGWFAARVALRHAESVKGPAPVMSCPWEFSPPDEERT